MTFTIELEIDEINYTAEILVDGGTDGNGYDEAPCAPDIEILEVYNEDGCELVANLSTASREAIGDKAYEQYCLMA